MTAAARPPFEAWRNAVTLRPWRDVGDVHISDERTSATADERTRAQRSSKRLNRHQRAGELATAEDRKRYFDASKSSSRLGRTAPNILA